MEAGVGVEGIQSQMGQGRLAEVGEGAGCLVFQSLHEAGTAANASVHTAADGLINS